LGSNGKFIFRRGFGSVRDFLGECLFDWGGGDGLLRFAIAILIDLFERLEGAVVGALGGGFVTAEKLEGVVASGFLEGEGEAAIFVHGFECAVEVDVDAADFDIEKGDFDGIKPHELPHVGGEESDEILFDFVDGCVAGEIGGEVVVVCGAVLVAEGDGVGAETVDHAVFGDFARAIGGDGPVDLAPLRRDWVTWASERGLLVVVDIRCDVLLRTVVSGEGRRIGGGKKD
jgi:hypothetical protein